MIRWMALPVAVGLLAMPTTASAKTIGPEQFGLHVQTLGAGRHPVGLRERGEVVGLRVRWDQIETSKGVYNWAALDRAVSAAERAGADEILYVLGSTP